MILDGRKLAKEIKKELKAEITKLPEQPVLSVLITQTDPVTEQFTRVKQRIGESVGVRVDLVHLYTKASTEEVIGAVKQYAQTSEAVIVQLPMPEHVDVQKVLKAPPASVDVDVIGDEAVALFEASPTHVLPPVVGAMREIIERNAISVKGKKVLVVGEGKLVGKPAAVWFRSLGGQVTISTKESNDLAIKARDADIIALGAGVPGLLQPDMIKEGVVILDAGTSEAGGVVAGDADPKCAEKASLFTPVPGGIGPIAVTMIFKNLLNLVRSR